MNKEKKEKEMIPWCECTFMDVDVNTYNKFVNRKKEIHHEISFDESALIECLKDENLHHVKKERIIQMEFARQYEMVENNTQFNYVAYSVFDELIHDMSFLEEK